MGLLALDSSSELPSDDLVRYKEGSSEVYLDITGRELANLSNTEFRLRRLLHSKCLALRTHFLFCFEILLSLPIGLAVASSVFSIAFQIPPFSRHSIITHTCFEPFYTYITVERGIPCLQKVRTIMKEVYLEESHYHQGEMSRWMEHQESELKN